MSHRLMFLITLIGDPHFAHRNGTPEKKIIRINARPTTGAWCPLPGDLPTDCLTLARARVLNKACCSSAALARLAIPLTRASSPNAQRLLFTRPGLGIRASWWSDTTTLDALRHRCSRLAKRRSSSCAIRDDHADGDGDGDDGDAHDDDEEYFQALRNASAVPPRTRRRRSERERGWSRWCCTKPPELVIR